MAGGTTELGMVLDESPAAVLVVDLATRQIVHANDIAEQLAPHLRLPVGLDAWSDAAVLRDPDGAELSDTEHPLSRVARAEPIAGQAVSAARRSAMGARREPLWMVAMSMSDAPMLAGHALVVLIPMRYSEVAELLESGDEDVRAAAAAEVGERVLGHELRDRALNATTLSVTVADAFDPEQPIVWVNNAFTVTTGYTSQEALGRNCRFLQGPETDTAGPRRLREAVEQGISVSVTLLNYRKDGTTFHNQVDLSPVRDPEGRIAHFVGIQTDVTVRVEAQLATRRALDAEREARADAETARSRSTFLIKAMNQLHTTLDTSTAASRLLSLVVPYLADWAVLLPASSDGAAGLMGRHRHRTRQGDLDALVAHLPTVVEQEELVESLLGADEMRLVNVTEAGVADLDAAYLAHPLVAGHVRDLDGRQALIVGLSGRAEVHDVLVLVRTPGRRPFSEADVDLAVDLGRRAGMVLENASLSETQARIAEVLQRSLLPDLPDIDGIQAAARYLPNETTASIGGDFYELLDYGVAGIGIAIGDVSGHDILAAAAMGHLKGLLRAAAFDDFASPAVVLEKVDRLILGLGMPTIASAVFAHAVREGNGWRMTWTGAGHPPLLVRTPDGAVEILPTHLNDLLLGVHETIRTQHELHLPAGTTVLGYTDGLLERRSETLDVSTTRLAVALTTAPTDAEDLCDHVLAAMSHGARDDDIALLAVTLT